MTEKEIVRYLEETPMSRKAPSLTVMAELMEGLGHPEQSLSYIHVAGTNGKGSICACLDSILQASGYRVGRFTSPHLHHYAERICINGEPVQTEEMAWAVEKLQAVPLSHPLTLFERITAMGFLLFQKRACDIVILEVGLGGSLDPTNIIPAPEVAVIGALGLEHTRELGDTLHKIATAKAGIIKQGCTVVSYGGEAESVIVEACRQKQAVYRPVDFQRIQIQNASIFGTHFCFSPWESLFFPLAGLHQCRNAAVALTAIEALQERGWAISHLQEGLAKTVWAGRLEVLQREPLILLDGAHNPHGISAVAESLTAYFPEGNLVFVLGVLEDKDYSQMLDALCPLAKSFVTVTPPSPRALSAERLAELCRERGKVADASSSVLEAMRKAVQWAGEQGRVCALGSLYLSEAYREAVEILGRKE